MMRSWILLTAITVVVTLVGCGDSGKVESVAEQDELSQWVDKNPAPEEVPLEGTSQ